MLTNSRGSERPSSFPPYPTRTPIWLDCDTGHDDAFAILLAGCSPAVRFLGISTVYGNASLEDTTYNSRGVLKSIEREDVPVYAGASRPLFREPACAPDIHGKTGLDGTLALSKPTVPSASDETAVDAMYRALKATEANTSWIVATGALTNIAFLFRSHPDVTDHIAGLSIMGGAIGNGFTDARMGTVDGQGERFGNWTPYAEFNIYCDPEAASEIFSNPALACKTTLIPLDLTHQLIATAETRYALLFGYGCNSKGCEPTMEQISTVRRLFFEILTFFAKTYRDVFGFLDGPPCHDPLAVVAAYAPSLFHCSVIDPALTSTENLTSAAAPSAENEERFSVEVVTEGDHGASDQVRNGPSQCGRTIARLLPSGHAGVRIPRKVETVEVWSMIESCLARAELARQRTATRRPIATFEPTTGRGSSARRSPASAATLGATSQAMRAVSLRPGA